LLNVGAEALETLEYLQLMKQNWHNWFSKHTTKTKLMTVKRP
jgi:hypothetical protein